MRRIIARAPTRIDFVGGWTDVQPFCNEEPGVVINAAFGVYAHVVVSEADVAQEQDDKFIRAVCRRFGLENVTVELESDAPVGSGLGGSGAVGVALVGGLAAYAERTLTRREIAELAHRIEIEDLDNIGGKQDQYAAAFGSFSAMTFLQDTVQIEPLVLEAERVKELHARSVVVYTGQSHISGNIHAQVQDAYHDRNPKTLAALATMRCVASDFRRELLRGSVDALGELLNSNWDAQKDLHPATTNARVDALFRAAMDAGACGGKALGAGGGGCLYFLAKKGETVRLVDALQARGAQRLDASFDVAGLEISG